MAKVVGVRLQERDQHILLAGRMNLSALVQRFWISDGGTRSITN
jgi:hypothetical protein